MSKRPATVVAVALLSIVSLPTSALAQEATPLASPVAADPAECRIEPRPDSFFEDAVRQAVANPAPAATFPSGGGTNTPTPIAVSEAGSVPADAETVAAVTATTRELFACINAGDTARLFALFTERAARDNFAFLFGGFIGRALDEGTPPAAVESLILGEIVGPLTGAPVPVPSERRSVLIAVHTVRTLDDGRVVAEIEATGEGVGPAERLLFAKEGERFLLDGTVARSGTGTPVATPTG